MGSTRNVPTLPPNQPPIHKSIITLDLNTPIMEITFMLSMITVMMKNTSMDIVRIIHMFQEMTTHMHLEFILMTTLMIILMIYQRYIITVAQLTLIMRITPMLLMTIVMMMSMIMVMLTITLILPVYILKITVMTMLRESSWQ